MTWLADLLGFEVLIEVHVDCYVCRATSLLRVGVVEMVRRSPVSEVRIRK